MTIIRGAYARSRSGSASSVRPWGEVSMWLLRWNDGFSHWGRVEAHNSLFRRDDLWTWRSASNRFGFGIYLFSWWNRP